MKSGTWIFFREGLDFMVEELLEYFGDLDEVFEESGPGKYAARLGLSFSPTVESINASGKN